MKYKTLHDILKLNGRGSTPKCFRLHNRTPFICRSSNSYRAANRRSASDIDLKINLNCFAVGAGGHTIREITETPLHLTIMIAI